MLQSLTGEWGKKNKKKKKKKKGIIYRNILKKKVGVLYIWVVLLASSRGHVRASEHPKVRAKVKGKK